MVAAQFQTAGPRLQPRQPLRRLELSNLPDRRTLPRQRSAIPARLLPARPAQRGDRRHHRVDAASEHPHSPRRAGGQLPLHKEHQRPDAPTRSTRSRGRRTSQEDVRNPRLLVPAHSQPSHRAPENNNLPKKPPETPAYSSQLNANPAERELDHTVIIAVGADSPD